MDDKKVSDMADRIAAIMVECGPTMHHTVIDSVDKARQILRRATAKVKKSEYKTLRQAEMTWDELNKFARQRGTRIEDMDALSLEVFVHEHESPARAYALSLIHI